MRPRLATPIAVMLWQQTPLSSAPMYCGGIWVAVGCARCTRSLLTLAYATVLTVFFDVNASREERWLSAAFPGYPDYQARVKKLIPGVDACRADGRNRARVPGRSLGRGRHLVRTSA